MVKQHFVGIEPKVNDYDYFLIEYNYEEQVRTISYYFKYPQPKGNQKRWTVTQSIQPEDLKNSYVSTFMHHFDTHVKIASKEFKDDGTIILHNYDGSRIEQHTDKQGRIIIENSFDKNGAATFSDVHSYSTDGNIRYSNAIDNKGEKVASIVVMHDELNNPVWVKIKDAEGEYSFQTKYEYDEYGNFTSAIETEDGRVNRRIIREITY